jgi:hypothetical protein
MVYFKTEDQAKEKYLIVIVKAVIHNRVMRDVLPTATTQKV